MVLHSVLECLDVETIAAFVAGALDAAGLARVESHIACCAACQSVVADAAYGAIGNTFAVSSVTRRPGSQELPASDIVLPVSSTPWPTTLPQPGDVLASKYRVDRILGRGGMGTVFSAHHLELRHRVAIKILHRGGSAGAARFLREAQTCARLGNEHIVRAFDLGHLPGGAPYLVMEYLVGEDLSRVLARGPLPVSEAVQYVMQACEALVDAHAVGIVHRDLKPANLFLAQRPGSPPCIKVVDFGISKVIGEEANASHPALTSTGMILGSPMYMSPEQIRAHDVDVRTDIWSLGVILYESLTGRPPFSAASFSALSVAIATEPAAPPSSFRPEIEPGLDRLAARCLQKRPGDRIASVAELRRALMPFALDSAHADAPAVSVMTPRRTASSSHRALAAAAAGLAILGASIGLTTRAGRVSVDEPVTTSATLGSAVFAAHPAGAPSVVSELPPATAPIPIGVAASGAGVHGESFALSRAFVQSSQHVAVRRKSSARPSSASSVVPVQPLKPDPTATPD